MTTQSALSALLTSYGIEWNRAGSVYQTRRGKFKAVLAGIPGKLFWHARKHQADEMKAAMALAGAWLNCIDRKWEILIPVKPATIPAIADSLGIEPQTLAVELPEEIENPY
jgi:hypothetical protein